MMLYYVSCIISDQIILYHIIVLNHSMRYYPGTRAPRPPFGRPGPRVGAAGKKGRSTRGLRGLWGFSNMPLLCKQLEYNYV